VPELGIFGSSKIILWFVVAFILLSSLDFSIILFLALLGLVYKFSSAEKKAKYKAYFLKIKTYAKEILNKENGIFNCKKCNSINSLVKLNSPEGQGIKGSASS
jgi:hypothetical protein